MAKKRRGRTDRDHFTIARPRLVRSFSPLSSLPVLEVEDRRTFHPERDFRPSRSLSGNAITVSGDNVNKVRTTRRGPKYLPPGGRHLFVAPRGVAICVRRKQRREVLFAKRRTRAGGAKRKNFYSNVRC